MKTPSSQLPILPITAKGTGNGRQTANGPSLPRQAAVVAPIRSLGPNHRERIRSHLQALDQSDRYLRFGYAASDAQIEAYATGLDLERDEVFGIYNRKLELIAMAHLAFPAVDSHVACTEFGVSVLKSARGRGHAARLFERAAIHTRNLGFSQIMIHALSENAAMLHIARSAGAVITRDGSDSEAYLRLAPATFDSRITEIVEEQWALADYQYKQQGKHLRTLLTRMQSGAGLNKPETSDET